MGCLRLKNEEYKGKIVKMSNKRNDKPKNIKEESELFAVPKSTIAVFKWFLGGFGVLLITILGIGGWMANQLYDLNKKALTEDSMVISGIKEDINDIQAEVKDINDGLNGERGIYSRLATVEQKLNTPTISASEDTQQFIDTVSFVRNDIVSTSCISPNTCIGTDSDGEEYIAEDLIDEMILLTYTENDKEVYFLGQYNEQFHWDGFCVTNTYNLDGTLYGICESNFDDGKRLDYKSFCISESNDEKWIYSDKICNENYNSGTNIQCSFEHDKKKDFTNINVRITDIIYVDDFVKNIKPTVHTYYFGNSSNGKYNDDTGNAYEIIYNDDGTVKTLYVGKFKDGTFNDDTGNAWDIAYSNKGGYYVYNTGEFKDGCAVNKSVTPIDIDRINEIILEHKQTFNVELTWKQD